MSEISTTITRREGGRYHISPSYGYAGISSGVVEVLRISDTPRIDFPEDVDTWMDAHMSGQTMDELDSDERAEVLRMRTGPWVQYKYISSYNGIDDGEVWCIPAQEFLEHTSCL